MNTLRREVKETLQSITDECLVKLLAHLEALGVEDKEDLKFLKEDDLTGVLKPVQCRKLLGKYATTGLLDTTVIDSQPRGGDAAFNRRGVEQMATRHKSGRFHKPLPRRQDSGFSTDSSSSASSSHGDSLASTLTEVVGPQSNLVGPRDTHSMSSWSQEDDDDCWSDYDQFYREEFQDDDVMSEEKPVYMNLSDWKLLEKQGRQPHFLVAKELLTTERSYVGSLHTMHYVFYIELEKENTQSAFLPDNEIARIFSNTVSIYKLHHDFLLPQLEERIVQWNSNPRIGDIMKSNAPFLKIYSQYTNNMRYAMTLIDKLMKRSKRFNQIIHRLEKLPECKSLSLQHHMLEPMQRLTKYELFMKAYVNALPPDSTDLQDSQDALTLVSKACLHSNEALKKNEIFTKLLDISRRLTGVPRDFITPTRHLIAHGPVTETSIRNGENQARHLFLFNDLILVCTEHKTNNTFSVWKSLEMEGLRVIPRPSAVMSNTFELSNKEGSCLLLDQNLKGGSCGWEKKIQAVAKIYSYKNKERLSSVRHKYAGQSQEANCEADSKQLGLVPPVLISDPAITKCMICDELFTLMRRKKNCKACGKLICKSCSKKTPLKYRRWKACTACLACSHTLTEANLPTMSTAIILEDTPAFSEA